jgi:hypothetical protein
MPEDMKFEQGIRTSTLIFAILRHAYTVDRASSAILTLTFYKTY